MKESLESRQKDIFHFRWSVSYQRLVACKALFSHNIWHPHLSARPVIRFLRQYEITSETGRHCFPFLSIALTSSHASSPSSSHHAIWLASHFPYCPSSFSCTTASMLLMGPKTVSSVPLASLLIKQPSHKPQRSKRYMVLYSPQRHAGLQTAILLNQERLVTVQTHSFTHCPTESKHNNSRQWPTCTIARTLCTPDGIPDMWLFGMCNHNRAAAYLSCRMDSKRHIINAPLSAFGLQEHNHRKTNDTVRHSPLQ